LDIARCKRTCSRRSVYEGRYNELNQPPFATLDAIGYCWRSVELVVAGTNLTDVYNQRFTLSNGGVPQNTLAGPQPTNSYALQGTAFNISLIRHFSGVVQRAGDALVQGACA
jgi:hypothetical protein